MAFELVVKGPNGERMILTKEQFQVVEPLIVIMMNKGKKLTDTQIIDILDKAGIPIVF